MKIRTILITTVLVVGAGTATSFIVRRTNDSSAKAVEVVAVPLVNSASYNYGDSGTVSGTIISKDTQVVMLDTSHDLVGVYVVPGDRVKKGDKLLEYDMLADELHAEMEELTKLGLELRLRSQKKDLETLRSGRMPDGEESDDYSDFSLNYGDDDDDAGSVYGEDGDKSGSADTLAGLGAAGDSSPGTSKTDADSSGASKAGASSSDTSKNGASSSGASKTGVSSSGTLKTGASSSDTSKTGASSSDTSKEDLPKAESSSAGTLQTVPARTGLLAENLVLAGPFKTMSAILPKEDVSAGNPYTGPIVQVSADQDNSGGLFGEDSDLTGGLSGEESSLPGSQENPSGFLGGEESAGNTGSNEDGEDDGDIISDDLDSQENGVLFSDDTDQTVSGNQEGNPSEEKTVNDLVTVPQEIFNELFKENLIDAASGRAVGGLFLENGELDLESPVLTKEQKETLTGIMNSIYMSAFDDAVDGSGSENLPVDAIPAEGENNPEKADNEAENLPQIIGDFENKNEINNQNKDPDASGSAALNANGNEDDTVGDSNDNNTNGNVGENADGNANKNTDGNTGKNTDDDTNDNSNGNTDNDLESNPAEGNDVVVDDTLEASKEEEKTVPENTSQNNQDNEESTNGKKANNEENGGGTHAEIEEDDQRNLIEEAGQNHEGIIQDNTDKESTETNDNIAGSVEVSNLIEEPSQKEPEDDANTEDTLNSEKKNQPNKLFSNMKMRLSNFNPNMDLLGTPNIESNEEAGTQENIEEENIVPENRATDDASTDKKSPTLEDVSTPADEGTQEEISGNNVEGDNNRITMSVASEDLIIVDDESAPDDGAAAEDGANQNGADQNGADQNGADQNGADQNGADQNGADQNGADQNGVDQNGVADLGKGGDASVPPAVIDSDSATSAGSDIIPDAILPENSGDMPVGNPSGSGASDQNPDEVSPDAISSERERAERERTDRLNRLNESNRFNIPEYTSTNEEQAGTANVEEPPVYAPETNFTGDTYVDEDAEDVSVGELVGNINQFLNDVNNISAAADTGWDAIAPQIGAIDTAIQLFRNSFAETDEHQAMDLFGNTVNVTDVHVSTEVRGQVGEATASVMKEAYDRLCAYHFIHTMLTLNPARTSSSALQDDWFRNNEQAIRDAVSEFTNLPDSLFIYNPATQSVEFSAQYASMNDTVFGGESILTFLRNAVHRLNYYYAVEESVDEPDTYSTEGEMMDDGGYDDEGGDDGPLYTAEEIQEAIKEQEKLIKETELQIREAELGIREYKKILDGRIVYATMDGIVKDAGSMDSGSSSNAFITITGREGLYVRGTVNELSLDTVKVGDVITGTSYETGSNFAAEIVEISPYPDTGNNFNYYGYGDENANSSYYPFLAYIENAEGLSVDSYVDLSLTGNASSMGADPFSGGLTLDEYFIRKDSSGRSYCYVRGEDGLLEKRYLEIGANNWGSVTIKSGLRQTDYIAFPYGKGVEEGAPTVEVNYLSAVEGDSY